MHIEKSQIYFDLVEMTKEEAIRFAGKKLVEAGLVEPTYVASMIEKETTDVTYIGNGIAIPHGCYKDMSLVKKTGIVLLHFRNGILYDEDRVYIMIGIAAKANDHLGILADIAIKLSDEKVVKKLVQCSDLEQFIKVFNS